MGCNRIGSFPDPPLIMGCGDQVCQILPLQLGCRLKTLIRLENLPSLTCQILFLGLSVFEEQIVLPSKQTFCSCFRSVCLRSARNSPEAHSVPSSEFFLAILYFLLANLLV